MISHARARRLLLSTAAVTLLASVALSAHLKLLKSTPAADATVSESPKTVQIWYSEEPLLPMSGITIAGPKGAVSAERLRAGDAHSLIADLPAALAPGKYEVRWKTAGDDGHVLRGTFSFSVGTAKTATR